MELDKVSFRYSKNKPLIESISGIVPTGKILCLIGPNGAGKSTILQLMAGELRPISGKVTIDGQQVFEMDIKKRAQKIAVAAQRNRLYDEMTVEDIVKTGRSPYHGTLATISNGEIKPIIQETHLDKLVDKSINTLSRGQQQRVWLAAAIAQDPDYLLLDEPTTYLDIHYQAELMNLIKKLQKEHNLTVVMVLHDINQALKISDEIWCIKNGQKVYDKAPMDLTNENILADLFNSKIKVVNIPQYGPYVIQIPE